MPPERILDIEDIDNDASTELVDLLSGLDILATTNRYDKLNQRDIDNIRTIFLRMKRELEVDRE